MLQNAPTFCWPTMVHNNKIELRKVTEKGCPVSSSPYEGCSGQNQESCFRIIWAPFLWHYKNCQCPIVMFYFQAVFNLAIFSIESPGLHVWWQFSNWMFSTFWSSWKNLAIIRTGLFSSNEKVNILIDYIVLSCSTIFDDGRGFRMVLRWEKTRNLTKVRRALHRNESENEWECFQIGAQEGKVFSC